MSVSPIDATRSSSSSRFTLVRTLEQDDAIGKRVAVPQLALGERRCRVEAEQGVVRVDLHFLEQFLVGSSSTTIAMFCMASRNRFGIVVERVCHVALERGPRHSLPAVGALASRAFCSWPSEARSFGRPPTRCRARGSSRSRPERRTSGQSGFGLQIAPAVQDQRVGRRESTAPSEASRTVALRPPPGRRPRRCRSGWRRAAHDDRPEAQARRARVRARRSPSCGRRPAARSARPCRPAPRRRAFRRAPAPCRGAPSTWRERSRSSESAARVRRSSPAPERAASG